MEHINEFVDERQKGWCLHCGVSIQGVPLSRDHVPTKGLLDRPLPAHTPQVEVCHQCNNSFSLDEEYFVAFLSCVLSGSAVPEEQANPKIRRALERNPALVIRLEASKQIYTTQGEEQGTIWQPEIERIKRIVLKNARGHAFYEYGEPMLDAPAHIWAAPYETLTASQQEEFEDVQISAWPEVGSRMMTRFVSGIDLENGWVIVQEDIYRYAIVQKGTLLVRSLIRNYLATEVFWE